jgi:hypothetical protein
MALVTILIISTCAFIFVIDPSIANDNYLLGYDQGKVVGYQEGNASGYGFGYSIGWSEGNTTGYSSGYSKGNDIGYISGYSEGNTVGHNSGYSEGNSLGLIEGNKTGYSLGTQVGFQQGNTTGYNLGYLKGSKDGAGSGYNIRDPTYNEMSTFIKNDLTDLHAYDYYTYNCFHYTRDVIDHAFVQGIKVGLVYIEFSGGAHAIVVFKTIDKGLIFIEPQNDEIVTLAVGQGYELIEEPNTILVYTIIW